MNTVVVASSERTSLVEEFDAAFDAIIDDTYDDTRSEDDEDVEYISFTSIL